MADQVQQQDIITLQDLLEEIRSRKLILTEEGKLWASHISVPRTVRRAIRQHRKALLFLIEEGEIHVCINAQMHRRTWYYAGNCFFVCNICKELGRSIKRLERMVA